MLTRSYLSVRVVRRARTSNPWSRSSVHNPKAESFPALHENTTGVGTLTIVYDLSRGCDASGYLL
jgi:hypothetical protein